MATKGAKLAAKRGRRRIEGVKREPNGRISRTEHPANQIGIEARARMFKISVEQARDQQAGTFLGRLHMAYIEWQKLEKSKSDGKPQPEMSLTTGQYHALLSCKEAHNDFLKATGAPGAHYESVLGRADDPDAHGRWCKNARKRWMGDNGKGGIKGAIYQAQEHERALNLWAALDWCVIQEQYFPHMVPELRVLGNTLQRHFKSA